MDNVHRRAASSRRIRHKEDRLLRLRQKEDRLLRLRQKEDRLLRLRQNEDRLRRLRQKEDRLRRLREKEDRLLMADRPDDVVAAVMQAWVTVAGSWIEASNDIVVAWLDVADVESGRPSFNEEIVTLSAQPAPTSLHPRAFSNWDDDQLPHKALTVEPGQVKAGEATQVRLLVQPPEGAVSGTYTGSLCDSNGASLLDEISVYVVGDTPPLPRGG